MPKYKLMQRTDFSPSYHQVLGSQVYACAHTRARVHTQTHAHTQLTETKRKEAIQNSDYLQESDKEVRHNIYLYIN